MKRKPVAAYKISVLMPVLNGNLQHISESINSILNQTFTDFEFVIIDDGSNEETKRLLSSYGDRDKRIKILANSNTLGVGKSLNIGLSIATGEYIARHDADDNAKPSRFEKQLNYFKANPTVSLCCTSVNHIDMEGKKIGGYPCSTDSKLLEAELLLNSRLCHPSLMIKTETLKRVGGYPTTKSAQDYLLYLKLLKHNAQFGGLSDHLVDYRINDQSITRKSRSKQLLNAEMGSYEHVTRLLGTIDRNSFSNFWFFIALQGNGKITLRDLWKVRRILKLIRRDRYYRKAWLGPIKFISRNALDAKFSLKHLLIAGYFRFLF